jgi:hypothetical protein
MFTAAEVDSFGFGRIIFQGREIATLVASIAEGLRGALAAGTPVVALACYDVNGIGTLLGNLWF